MPKKSSKTVLPDPLPNGEVLQDIAKKKWILGPSIGVGGFGEIYAAAEHTEGNKKSSSYDFVVKIEPHGNGPLFCEMHFFVRNAKPDMIKTWCTENKVTSLGMPRYLGSGSHEHNGKKYRFLVMDRYGKDLWHIFLENKKQFPISTVYRISLQLVDVLEYIHSVGYVHADIKGANILLGHTKQTQNQVFLVDYGLVSHYTKKDFKIDPKKAHNGTIEYTSRDAHDGVPTRRGDIEILAFNMVQWMGTTLPWEKNLSDPVAVQNSKKKYMDDVPGFLKTCFGKKTVPGALKEFLEYVNTMKYDTEPDYKKLRTTLTKGLKNEGGSLSGALEFKLTSKHKSQEDINSPTPEKRPRLTPKQKKTTEEPKRRGRKAKEIVEINDSASEEEEEDIPVKQSKSRSKKTTEEPKRGGRKAKEIVEINDSESEAEEEEDIPVKQSKSRSKKKETEEGPATNGYNAEMLRLQRKIAERKAGKPKKTVKKSNSSNSGNDLNSNFGDDDDNIIDETPPERLVRRRRNMHTPTLNGDSESDVTPRTLRKRL